MLEKETIKGALKSNWIFQSEAKSVNVLLYETADSDETWQPKGANQNELKLLAAMFNQWIETWGKEPRFHETLTNNWWPTIESERKLKSLSLCNASVELVRGGGGKKQSCWPFSVWKTRLFIGSIHFYRFVIEDVIWKLTSTLLLHCSVQVK